jgi:pentatricopeptide repeat protein
LANVCKSSNSAREWLNRAHDAGLPMDAVPFNRLLCELRLEGRDDELEGVLSEMDARGIVRDVKTEKYLSLPAEELSRMRRARLQELAEDGDFARMKELFESLLARRQADWIHLNVAMLHLCKDYASRRELLRHAETAGVSPSTSTYNLLLSTLQMEGRKDELEGVLSEMDARGIVRDVKTEKYLTLPAEELSRMRAAFLKKLVNAGEQETAQGVLDRLISRNEAHQAHHAIVARAGRHE